MDEEKVGFFKKIIISVSNPEKSKFCLKEKTGKAILYAFLITLIFGGILLGSAYYKVCTYINAFENETINSFETIQLSNGELTVSPTTPFVYKEKDYYVEINTNTEPDETVLDDYQTGIIVSKDKAIFKQDSMTTKTINFSQIKDTGFNKNDIKNLLGSIKYIFIPIGLVIALLFIFLLNLFFALMLAVIGMIINAMYRGSLEFGDVYKLSIYSLTLPSILYAIVGLLELNIAYLFLICFAISIAYLWLALSRIIKQDNIEKPEI